MKYDTFFFTNFFIFRYTLKTNFYLGENSRCPKCAKQAQNKHWRNWKIAHFLGVLWWISILESFLENLHLGRKSQRSISQLYPVEELSCKVQGLGKRVVYFLLVCYSYSQMLEWEIDALRQWTATKMKIVTQPRIRSTVLASKCNKSWMKEQKRETDGTFLLIFFLTKLQITDCINIMNPEYFITLK